MKTDENALSAPSDLRLADGSAIQVEQLGLDAQQTVQLLRWQQRALHGLPENTWRALCADLALFHSFCRSCNQDTLPAAIRTVEAFVEWAAPDRKLSTVRRYLASIGRWHRIIGATDPTRAETVGLTLRAAVHGRRNREDQAEPLNWQRLKKITEHYNQIALEVPHQRLRWLRDRALLWLAYDMLARVSELISLDVEDLSAGDDGRHVIALAHSKTDQDALGVHVFVSRMTAELLTTWLHAADLQSGPLFRPVNKGGRITAARASGEPRLTERSVNRMLKERASWILDGKALAGVSGHSMRVGAAQDLVADNFGTPAVKQAGRWKSDRMPARYTERLAAHRGAMAKLAARQGRM